MLLTPEHPLGRFFMSKAVCMPDTFWDGVGRELAAELEPLFYVNQTNVMEAAVKILTAEAIKANRSMIPQKPVLCELHRSATLFLLSDAGSYRSINVAVFRPDGSMQHQPPVRDDVESLMADFFGQLMGMWDDSDPISIASFVLWRINWVHPFQNGNGRTARAFSYLCLCIKFGFWLPGDPTVVDLITADRAPYEAALAELDRSYADKNLDLTPMTTYLGSLLERQLRPFMSAEANAPTTVGE